MCVHCHLVSDGVLSRGYIPFRNFAKTRNKTTEIVKAAGRCSVTAAEMNKPDAQESEGDVCARARGEVCAWFKEACL